MGKTLQVETWVVYKKTLHGKPDGLSAVCEQSEWDEMEQLRPGYHTLVRAGIRNEQEAETQARDGSGYVATKVGRRLPARG